MENILIIQAARFGDLIQTKRLIASLTAVFNAHLAVDKSLVPLARLIYPDLTVHGVTFHGRLTFKTIEENKKVFDILRGLDFARIYNCNFSPLTAAICRMFPEKIITGYRLAHNSNGGIWRSPWDRLVFNLSGARWAATLNLEDVWGLQAPLPAPPERINPPARPGGRGIGIALSGREARRSLPMPALAAIAQMLFKFYDAPSITLLGSESEKKAAHQFMREADKKMLAKIRDLSGKTDWRNLIMEVSGLDLLLTPDTGIMHLAAHLGTPVMAFFLSSAWCHETGPYGEGHYIWQTVKQCSPCLESAPCPHKVACLEPFTRREFLRSLHFFHTGDLSRIDPGPHLQLWRTGFDKVGAKLELKAGIDVNAASRAATRQAIANYLGYSYRFINLPPDKLDALIKKLFPDPDWMLPPWRYF